MTTRSTRKACTTAAVEAIRMAKERGFRVNINCTLFNDAEPDRVAKFFDSVKAMGVDGITVSPGYAYERAPDQQHFLNRNKTKQLFRDILSRGRAGKNWAFSQSTMFLDFLAGNQTYKCTPWGNPARTVFGWQRPCYLVGEGYVKTFKELMEDTDRDAYGVGNYEKCADCMVHSGFEATAVADNVLPHPLKAALGVTLRGVKTTGAMAPTSRWTSSARPTTCSRATWRSSWPRSATCRRKPSGKPKPREAQGDALSASEGTRPAHRAGRMSAWTKPILTTFVAKSGFMCLPGRLAAARAL